MTSAAQLMRGVAAQLVATSRTPSDPHVPEVVLVSERLRISLTRFAGADGFAALMRRAVMLAKTDVASLQDLKIDGAGRLELEPHGAGPGGAGAPGNEAAVVITAHLLGLLVIFVGQPLTLKLVREAFPDASLDE